MAFKLGSKPKPGISLKVAKPLFFSKISPTISDLSGLSLISTSKIPLSFEADNKCADATNPIPPPK